MRMNLKGISELISATAIGTAFGFYVNVCNHRTFYIVRQTFWDDSQFLRQGHADAPPVIRVIAIWILLALIIFAIYEALVFAVSQVLLGLTGKSDTRLR